VEIIERETVHLLGPSLTTDLADLPVEVPALWRRAFEGHEDPESVLAELDEEQPEGSGYAYRITAGVLLPEPTEETTEVPAGRWLHHQHRGPVEDIGATYAAMYEHADEQGVALTNLRLDVGYRADGSETTHELYLQLA
jgi:predicted transcriptional regulator YdeE